MQSLQRILLSLSAVASVVAAAHAQSTAYSIEGPFTQAYFGSSLAHVGDVDGDGYDDFAVGAPNDDFGGVRRGGVYLYSGKTRTAIRWWYGANDGDQLGRSISGVGDVDGDGYGDLIVGEPYNDFAGTDAGRASVYSGATGWEIYSMFGTTAGGHFGWSVAGGGDANGDGHPDFIVGAPGEHGLDVGSGVVRVYSGATGLVLSARPGSGAHVQFGFSVAFAGDTDLDGRDEFLVGAPFTGASSGSAWGVAYLYDAFAPSVQDWIAGDAGDLMGWSVSSAGDANNDGRADYAAGGPFANNHAGRVVVVSGIDGSTYRDYAGPTGSLFGNSISNAGDVDGDGRDDLLVGMPRYTSLLLGQLGGARIYSGATGAMIQSLLGASDGSYFGGAVLGNIDVTRDGRPDAIIGAELADEGYTDGGIARVVFLDDAAGTLVCFGDGSGTACPCFNPSTNGGCKNSLGVGGRLVANGRASIQSDDVVLTATGMPNGTSLFFQGTFVPASGAGTVFGDGLRCAGGTVTRLGVHQNAFNRSIYPMNNEPPLSTFAPSGATRVYQVWYRNAAAFCSSATFNLTNAVSIDWRN